MPGGFACKRERARQPSDAVPKPDALTADPYGGGCTGGGTATSADQGILLSVSGAKYLWLATGFFTRTTVTPSAEDIQGDPGVQAAVVTSRCSDRLPGQAPSGCADVRGGGYRGQGCPGYRWYVPMSRASPRVCPVTAASTSW